MVAASTPPDPTTSPWLHLAAPVGRVAAIFLMAGCFLQLLAPLAFLTAVGDRADPAGPGGSLTLLLSDPGSLLAIGDFVGVLGCVVLACAFFLILFGLVRADKRVPFDSFLLGVAAFACLVTWVPAMLASEGIARGTIDGVDAAGATGGWGLASLLLLGASLAYLFFALRLGNGSRALKLGSLKWPMYAAVNVLGSAALAGYFAGGGANLSAFSLGLVLKVTIVPLLGVMAYADLRDRFPNWALVPLHPAPRIAAKRAVRRPSVPAKSVRAARVARPLPPPPDD